MLRDYYLRLRDLHQDRTQFQSERTRNSITHQANQQQDKYQAYIIEQINDRNRIIATHNITSIINHALKKQTIPLFKHQIPSSHLSDNSLNTSKISRQSRKSINLKEESVSVDMILVRISVDTISRIFQKATNQLKKESLNSILKHFKLKKVLQRTVTCLKRVNTRKAIHLLRGSLREKRDQQLFTDSFSMIARQDRFRRQRGCQDQSYLSFMLEKENVNSQCPSCRQSCHLGMIREREMARLGEEIIKKNDQIGQLRDLLTEKTLQLKRREEECLRLRQRGEEGDQSGLSESRNSSYFSDMERYILGGKRIRKNGSRASDSSNGVRGEQINRELLGKYMRESFQLKESMDLAREMCADLQINLSPNGKVTLQRILRVLSVGDNPSVDQIDS